jgi:hypothetical protein
MIFPGQDPRVLRIVTKSVRGLSYFHKVLFPLAEDQVQAGIVPFQIPEAFTDSMPYGERDPNVVRYWHTQFHEGEIHSAWLIQYFKKVMFIARVRRPT